MKFRQHIKVDGYPKVLKEVFGDSEEPINTILIENVGLVAMPKKGAQSVLTSYGIAYTEKIRSMKTRVRYLLASRGIGKAVRGKVVRGDIIYTIESNNERELLDLTDECLRELKALKVPHKQVCKWICPS